MRTVDPRVCLAVFVLLVGAVTTSTAKVIYVGSDGPPDFDNIQAAIDDANDGDTVVVKDGTYTGDGNRDIDFKGKAITVRSENGPGSCIIDCQASASDHHLGFIFHSAEGPNSVLDGFTITNGYHDDAGAILCTYVAIGDFRPSNPTIINCVITNNQGTYAGAIECGSHCEPSISNCVISNNVGYYTGGISYADECRPVISNCIVRGNSGSSGGGIRTGGAHCHGSISNCVITGNRATDGGAGLCWWSYGGSVEITNCTIVDNEDYIRSAGVYIGGGGGTTGTITNCIIWGNRGHDGPLAQIGSWSDGDLPTTVEVTYCDVEGGWPGEGNIDADPLFVDADGPDNIIGTDDDNCRLLGASPCLDAGNNAAVPPSMTVDLDENPRIVNGTVDMGAYEGPNQGLVVIPRSVTVPEGATATFTVALAMDPLGSVEVTVAVESGDPDITVQSPPALTFNSSNYAVPRTVTLAGAEDDDHLNGCAIVTVNAPDFHPITVQALESENDHILYVDADAEGLGTGFDWANAFPLLQDALAAARDYPKINEIRVAQGTYKPDLGHHQSPGDREASFDLVNGVAVKGGYAGYGEPDPNARDVNLHETILSGDLNDDDTAVADPCDLLDEPTRAENSYHVVKGFDFPDCHHEINTLLEGFTITGGNANGPISGLDYHAAGGGLLHQYVRGPKIANCTFRNNSAESGGAIFGLDGPIVDCVITNNAAWNGGGLSYCRGLIKGCTMQDNYAQHDGGAVYLWEGSPQIEDCTIRNNRAGWGGGVFIADASPELYNSTFSGNSATHKGGGMCSIMFDYSPSPVLTGCLFSQNSARFGGGMYNGYSWSRLTNCIFSGNSAEEGGGAANYDHSNLTVTNCTFAANSASNGKALACNSYNPEHPHPSNVQLTNCIFWDGNDGIWNNDDSTITIAYSDVQGGWLGEGNINTDPCFAGSDNGDYHLKSQAGRWDPNSESWIQDDVTSPCIDAGDPMSPIGLEPFPNGGIVNMGAYGGTAEASKSYFGEPVCETIIAADINGDCQIDFLDFRLMALHWLEDNNP